MASTSTPTGPALVSATATTSPEWEIDASETGDGQAWATVRSTAVFAGAVDGDVRRVDGGPSADGHSEQSRRQRVAIVIPDQAESLPTPGLDRVEELQVTRLEIPDRGEEHVARPGYRHIGTGLRHHRLRLCSGPSGDQETTRDAASLWTRGVRATGRSG